MLASGTEITDDLRADWLADRKHSLGASEVPAAIGLSYTTPVELWQYKTGRAARGAATEAMEWGNLLEPVIARQYEARTGRRLEVTQLFLRDSRHPWRTATLDGLTECGRVVEIKTAGPHAADWGDEETDDVPAPYLVQVTEQMELAGAEVADVAVLFAGQRLRIYTVEFSADLHAQVFDHAARFWRCVEADVPPDWGKVNASSLAVRNPRCEGAVALDGHVADSVSRYESAREQIRHLERLSEEEKLKVLAAMGNAREGSLPDGRLVRRHLREVAARTTTTKAYTSHYFTVTTTKGEQ